ncbi:hypothetical protein ABZP36_012889 [Zizania latifolia]
MFHRYSGGGHGENVTASPAMASTFSLFFPLPEGHQWPPVEEAAYDDHSTVTTSPSSPSSSTGSVDCTLSLGTPSSRRAEPVAAPARYQSLPATVSWDAAAESYYCQQGRPTAGAAKCAVAGGVGHDPLLDRRCASCGTTSTPLWRNGPRGPKSLCNACGIRFKKEERRAAGSATADGGGAGCGFSAQRARGSATRAPPAATCGEETLPCGGDVADAPFLAWRLNVVQPAATAFSSWMVNWVQVRRQLLSCLAKNAGLRQLSVDVDETGTAMGFLGAERQQLPVGRGARSVVLLHGFARDGIVTWGLQVISLAKRCDVCVPDLLHFGGSSSPPPDRSAGFQAACVAAALRRLGVERSPATGTTCSWTATGCANCSTSILEIER